MMPSKSAGERKAGGRGRSDDKGLFRRRGGRRKVCRFCAEKTLPLDYKEVRVLSNFITERGKIIPSRITGNCAKHQRKVALAVRRSPAPVDRVDQAGTRDRAAAVQPGPQLTGRIRGKQESLRWKSFFERTSSTSVRWAK